MSRRNSSDALLAALRRRAEEVGGGDFAEQVCGMVGEFQRLRAEDWPKMPKPATARTEAKRIVAGAVEVLGAIGDASPALRARLLAELQRRAFERGEVESQAAITDRIELVASELQAAASAIYQVQPPTRPKDAMREGFVAAMRAGFERHGVEFTATASESSGNSLAVDVVAAALGIEADAARKAIARVRTSST